MPVIPTYYKKFWVKKLKEDVFNGNLYLTLPGISQNIDDYSIDELFRIAQEVYSEAKTDVPF